MTQATAPTTRTAEQQKIVSTLETNFGIDGKRVLFLNSKDPLDPWIPASLLEKIARQIPEYQASSVDYSEHIRATEQFVYTATVIDTQNRHFTRTGVATIGESPIEGEEFDAHNLAAGRALSAALKAAGFHPCEVDFGREPEARAGQTSSDVSPENYHLLEDSKRRQAQLGVIHKLAKEKGLIVKLPGGALDMYEYRKMLQRNFLVNTAENMSEAQRKAVINFLDNYKPELHEIITEIPGAEHLAV